MLRSGARGVAAATLAVVNVESPSVLTAAVPPGASLDAGARYVAEVAPAARPVAQRPLAAVLAARAPAACVDGGGRPFAAVRAMVPERGGGPATPALGCAAAVAAGAAAHDALKALAGGALGGPADAQFLVAAAAAPVPPPGGRPGAADRYAAARAAFGNEGLRRLQRATVFVVGAGATLGGKPMIRRIFDVSGIERFRGAISAIRRGLDGRRPLVRTSAETASIRPSRRVPKGGRTSPTCWSCSGQARRAARSSRTSRSSACGACSSPTTTPSRSRI